MNEIGTCPIFTPRLKLRAVTLTDAEAIFNNWAQDDDVTKYLTWEPHADINVTRKVVADWLLELQRGDYFHWCLELLDNAKVIGTIAAVELDKELELAEVGYCLAQDHWGRGLMPEALSAVIDYFFTKVNLKEVEACHHPGNLLSGKVMQKSGMHFKGTRSNVKKDKHGHYYDALVYAVQNPLYDSF